MFLKSYFFFLDKWWVSEGQRLSSETWNLLIPLVSSTASLQSRPCGGGRWGLRGSGCYQQYPALLCSGPEDCTCPTLQGNPSGDDCSLLLEAFDRWCLALQQASLLQQWLWRRTWVEMAGSLRSLTMEHSWPGGSPGPAADLAGPRKPL